MRLSTALLLQFARDAYQERRLQLPLSVALHDVAGQRLLLHETVQASRAGGGGWGGGPGYRQELNDVMFINILLLFCDESVDPIMFFMFLLLCAYVCIYTYKIACGEQQRLQLFIHYSFSQTKHTSLSDIVFVVE